MDIKQMREKIKENQETKSLELSDFDVIKVYKYLLNRATNNDYEEILITKPYLQIIKKPSIAKQNKELMQRLKAYADLFGSDIYIQENATFDNYILDLEENRPKALKLVKKFIDDFPNEKGIYFHGSYGSGKSYLLSIIAKELTRKGYSALFVFVPDLVRNIKSRMSDNTLEKAVFILKNCDCLILDDLAGENVSAWFRDEILFPILHYRLAAKLPVIISSNATGKELIKIYSVNSESDSLERATRLFKRISDLTQPLKLNKQVK